MLRYESEYIKLCEYLDMKCTSETIKKIISQTSHSVMAKITNNVRSAGTKTFLDYDISNATMRWMNITLQSLCPQELLEKWQLTY
jgi:hypothetical protein